VQEYFELKAPKETAAAGGGGEDSSAAIVNTDVDVDATPAAQEAAACAIARLGFLGAAAHHAECLAALAMATPAYKAALLLHEQLPETQLYGQALKNVEDASSSLIKSLEESAAEHQFALPFTIAPS
jgi:hypothetical protein